MSRRVLLVIMCACLVGGAVLAYRLISGGSLEGVVEVEIDAPPAARDIAGSRMILSYGNGGLDVVYNDTSPCGDATWTRRYRVRLGERVIVNLDDGEHHVIIGAQEGGPRYVKVHWERKEGQEPGYRQISNRSGVFVAACEPDIILFDCRTVPPLRYTPENVTLARTLSNVDEEEMDYLLMVANMTPEQRQQGHELCRKSNSP
jgi:hypothetical protein